MRASTCPKLRNLFKFFLLFLIVNNCDGAPQPRNYLFETDDSTTIQPFISESVTSGEFAVMESDNEVRDDVVAQPSETDNVIASASSQSSSSSTANALTSSGSEGAKISSQQLESLLMLQKLQQQLQQRQQLQQQQQQNQAQPAQNQFSLDKLLKSVVKMLQVAKTKIDQGARTFRDILLLFDRKKYVNIIPQNQASENNFVTT